MNSHPASRPPAHCQCLAFVLVAVLALCGLSTPCAEAQTDHWTGATSTDWNTGTNWSITLPNSTSNITLDTNSGNQAVLSSGTKTIANITIGNTSASGADTLLTINGGAHLTVSHFFQIGNETGSTGTLLVTDTGTVLTTNENSNLPPSGLAIVGQQGNGSLTIANGAIVNGLAIVGNAAGISGSVLVTDHGTEWLPGLYLGAGINGTCNITVANGANLTTTAGGYVGLGANSNASVTITDSGSSWNATGNIAIGNGTNSSGYLTLANGGTVNMTSGNILLGVLGNGTLNLNSGAFFQDGNANGSLIFPSGNGGNATINWNGGTMQMTKNITFTPNMTMTGDGCIFDTNGFNCTFSGNISGIGNLTKNGNGTLNLTVMDHSNGLNSPLYTGSTIINTGTLVISPSGTTPAGFVMVSTNITDDSSAVLSPVRTSVLYYTGILTGNGVMNIQGNITFNGTSTFTGNLQIGSQPPSTPAVGTLTLNGDTSQMGGDIYLESGTLNFAQNFDTSYAGNLTSLGGQLGVLKTGSGNLTLTGNIIATPPFVPQVNSGNLILTGNTSQMQGIVLASGTNLIFNQAFDSSISRPQGSGNLIQEGTGTLTIFYPDDSGTILISSGTLAISAAYGPTDNIVDNSALVFVAPYDDPCSSIISGNGTVTINTSASLILSGNSTYTGTTTVNSGVLLVDGQLAAASNVAVSTGGALGGSGSVLGPITVAAGGGLVPGDRGVGTLSVTSLLLDPAATTTFSIADPGNYSALSVSGTLAETGNVILNLNSNLYVGTYQLISSTGGMANDFANVALTGLYSTTLTDSEGVWSGNVSGVNFTFNADTGQLVVAVPLPPGTSATKASWLETNFTTAQLVNPTISGDTASPNGDGIPNLLKYAFNVGPWDDGYTVLPQAVASNGDLVLSFTKRQNDVTYTVEASTDLINWSTAGIVVQTSGNSVTATYPLPNTGTAFMHVVVRPAP